MKYLSVKIISYHILFIILLFSIPIIYSKLSEKKINWKWGMVTGLIINFIFGIIPLIIAGIQLMFFGYPKMIVYLAIVFCIPGIIFLLILRHSGSSIGYLGSIMFLIITSSIIFGGIGAVVGFILEKLNKSKNIKQKKQK